MRGEGARAAYTVCKKGHLWLRSVFTMYNSLPEIGLTSDAHHNHHFHHLHCLWTLSTLTVRTKKYQTWHSSVVHCAACNTPPLPARKYEFQFAWAYNSQQQCQAQWSVSLSWKLKWLERCPSEDYKNKVDFSSVYWGAQHIVHYLVLAASFFLSTI